MRPLVFDYQQDPNVISIEDEFMCGPDILVCPVSDYELRCRDVYLPQGNDWIDVHTGKRYSGGTYLVDTPAPIDFIPVFVRDRRIDLCKIITGNE